MKMTADSERMLDTGDQMVTTADRLHCCMDGIEALAASMAGEWQGNAGAAYSGKIAVLRAEYDRLESFFKEYAGILGEAAESYEGLDKALAGRIDMI